MDKLQNVNFWCHKILPLSYDASLTYYEVLCKLTEYVNYIIHDMDHIETDISEIVIAWLNAHYSIPFYNVANYDITPGTTDNYQKIHDLLKNTVQKTGGIVFFPKGKYVTSYTLFVPENTIFIGEGTETEIYFNETDTTLGCALANAGSNIAIMNMKVSSVSAGTFHSGAQPGAIGISDLSNDNSDSHSYSHTFFHGDVSNILIANIYCDSNYALQIEPSSAFMVSDITVRNVHSPKGCVSIQPNNFIKNITVDNVTCDLFRIYDNSASTEVGVKNCVCNNIICNSFLGTVYRDPDDQAIVINNLRQTDNTRNNDILTSGCSCVINGNFIFNNCYFQSISTETYGISVYNGKLKFTDCVFDMYSRAFYPNVSITNDTYSFDCNGCTFNVLHETGTTVSYLFGTGKNNIYNTDKVVSRLWGELYASKLLSNNVSPSTFRNKVTISGDQAYLKLFVEIENGEIFTWGSNFTQFPFITDEIPVTLWNSTSGISTQVTAYASVVDGVLTVTMLGITLSEYDRALIECPLLLSDTPTAAEIYNLLL